MADNQVLPIPISYVANRYLLYDIEAVTYLRKYHSICGVFIGTLPQHKQQNVFLGLPLALMPEEARLLVEKKIAYIIDDVEAHMAGMLNMPEAEREAFLRVMELQGIRAGKANQEKQSKRKEKTLKKLALEKTKAAKAPETGTERDNSATPVSNAGEDAPEEDVLFDARRSSSPTLSNVSTTTDKDRCWITPTTSVPPLSPPSPESVSESLPAIPSSYPLFKHLHERGYFMTPGLRFGCQYTVYPGDPLRFHSHFLAAGFEWDEEIDLLDLVGGGRLGTGVKKGFLLGGKDAGKKEVRRAEPAGSDDDVRTFCIEWSAM